MSNSENIPLLLEILEAYENGTLDITTQQARKCYLSEKERYLNRVAWIHNDELKNQILLRKMSKNNSKDLLRNTKL